MGGCATQGEEAALAKDAGREADLEAAVTSMEARIARLERQLALQRERLEGLDRRLGAFSGGEAVRQQAVADLQAAQAAMTRRIETLAAGRKEAGGQSRTRNRRPSYGLHLASFRSADNAARQWQALKNRFGDVLEGKEARLDPLDLGQADGSFVRLLAGPYDGAVAAGRACEMLQRANAFCQIIPFAGRPLEK